MMSKEEIGKSYENYFNEFMKEWMNLYDPIMGEFNHSARPISKEEYLNQNKDDNR